MSATWIISFIIAVVAICAGLAALGFRGRITTIGVDLGTTFSVVGINKNGKVIIIEDATGHKIFPSVVSYQDNGEILTAYDALPYLSRKPLNTIYNAKRFIGRSLEDENVRQYASEHPFKVIDSSVSNFSKVAFQINATGHRPIVTPEDVGTQVLKFLLRITGAYLKHNQVNKAVIAVPAKFDSNQRKATAECYKQAGLKVVRVIEEPTAAAVAYKLHKKSTIHHILVYDFGGGTLDVSLLYVSKGSVQVYATDGDETLGGSDLDLCLSAFIKQRVQEVSGLVVDELYSAPWEQSRQQDDRQQDELCLPASVHSKAEEVKKKLTYADSVEFSCIPPPPLGSGKASDPEAGRAAVRFNVTRTEFEETCATLFSRGLVPVDRLLQELEMRRDDVDEVVLVGGTTRVPRVKAMLRSYFGKELNDHIDPDITVAYGAASILD